MKTTNESLSIVFYYFNSSYTTFGKSPIEKRTYEIPEESDLESLE